MFYIYVLINTGYDIDAAVRSIMAYLLVLRAASHELQMLPLLPLTNIDYFNANCRSMGW